MGKNEKKFLTFLIKFTHQKLMILQPSNQTVILMIELYKKYEKLKNLRQKNFPHTHIFFDVCV